MRNISFLLNSYKTSGPSGPNYSSPNSGCLYYYAYFEKDYESGPSTFMSWRWKNGDAVLLWWPLSLKDYQMPLRTACFLTVWTLKIWIRKFHKNSWPKTHFVNVIPCCLRASYPSLSRQKSRVRRCLRILGHVCAVMSVAAVLSQLRRGEKKRMFFLSKHLSLTDTPVC